MRSRGRLALLALVAVSAAGARPAAAYDFTVGLRTIGQGYQVRGFAADGSNELLSRRRLTQYMDLAVFDLAPARWRGDDGDRNLLYFDASLRFDSDFGGYMVGRPTGSNEIHELQQSQLDILYAFLGGRNVGGRVDFMLGRQIRFDLVDFFAFDGGDALVHVTRNFGVEAYGGTEVRGDLPLSAPIYELDGTSAGSRDPATRPDQNSMLRPLAGVAVVGGSEGGPVMARLAYRRVWSATADQQAGEPDAGVNDEKLSLTTMAMLRNRAVLAGGVRFNLLLGEFDDEQLMLKLRTFGKQWLTLEHAYLAPSFDGDSIWNVFATGAYRDLRAVYEVGLGTEVKAYARGFARFFTDSGRAGGASMGATWRRGRGYVRADGYWEDGFGGRKVGVDASARLGIRRAFEVEGRLTGFEWRADASGDAARSPNDAGVTFGAQGGGRWQLGQGVKLHLLAEDNFGTFYKSAFRGLAVVEVDASL
ncbi:MAG TPA: hypothetical protein VN903_20210 [Polyangia bacterium]|nr:hypothetical protein [Polyangia bacterium]